MTYFICSREELDDKSAGTESVEVIITTLFPRFLFFYLLSNSEESHISFSFEKNSRVGACSIGLVVQMCSNSNLTISITSFGGLIQNLDIQNLHSQ